MMPGDLPGNEDTESTKAWHNHALRNSAMPRGKRPSKPKQAVPTKSSRFAKTLAQFGREFHLRGWALGTSGNYSVVLRHEPLRLLINSSGLDKSILGETHFLEVDEAARLIQGNGKPSAEALLHAAVARSCRAGCVLHTHSVWSTLLSDRHASRGGLALSGYEMLKGLEGVKSHSHREWLPIFENSQDLPALAQEIENSLTNNPHAHGFLLRAHGLYTWGEDPAQARRHVEILEFLLEVAGRKEFSEAGTTPA
jgi:methylthioribulose-1-phosphate dehydratase